MEATKSSEGQVRLFDRLETEKIKKDYFDLDLNDQAMRDMEILIGPRANQAQKQVIVSLVKVLNPSANILESKKNKFSRKIIKPPINF